MQLAVATSNFILCPLLFSDVKEETLVAFDLAGGITSGKTGFKGSQGASVTLAKLYFEAADVIMRLYLPEQLASLLQRGIECVGIQRQ